MSGAMNHPLSQIIQRYLITRSLGTAPEDQGSWPVFFSNRSKSPNDCITIYDTEGITSGRKMKGGEVQEHLGIQVMVRSEDLAEGYRKCHAIILDFDQQVSRTLVPMGSDTYRIQSISRTSAVISAGREKGTGCRLHSANAVVSLRLLPGTGSY